MIGKQARMLERRYIAILTQSVCRCRPSVIVPQQRVNNFQIFQPSGSSLGQTGGGVGGEEGQEHPQGVHGNRGYIQVEKMILLFDNSENYLT